MGSRKGRVYVDLTPTSEVERLFLIYPWLKGKTIQSYPEQEVIVEQETTDNNKNKKIIVSFI